MAGARRWLLEADLRHVAMAVFGAIALLAALGALSLWADPPLDRRLHPDREATLPALFSSLLLLAAGAAAFALRASRFGDARAGRALAAVGGFFAFMAIDEAVVLHEHLHIWTGVRWQFLYAPLVAAAGVAWLIVLAALWRSGSGARAYAAGALAWGLAQAIEIAQLEGSHGHTSQRGLVLPEETLEMTGSALFALGLLAAIRATREAPSPPSRARHP